MIAVQSHPCLISPTKLNPQSPLFVFLPGMDGTGKLLRTQTAGLEPGFDVRCLAIPPDDLTNWEELTAKVVSLIHTELQASPRRPVYLCGESFGGCLALKVATYAPQLFERVILVNPASSFRSRPFLVWGSKLVHWIPEVLYQNSTAAFLPFLASLERISPEDRQALWEVTHSLPQTTSLWRFSLLNQFQVSDSQLQQLSMPILLIASREDRLLPSVVEVQRLAQKLPDARIVTLPDSGHACLLEQAVNLYEIMRSTRFLSPSSSSEMVETASSEG
jgi:pimeloyl-ACP methyl ester carboxylesterase